jgi:hypothetical protein
MYVVKVVAYFSILGVLRLAHLGALKTHISTLYSPATD